MRPTLQRFHLPTSWQVWFLGLTCLFLLSCGSSSSDNTPNLEPRASVGGPPVSEQGPPPRNDQITPAASPAPLAASRSPTGHGEARPAETVAVPDWMSVALASPDVRVRLQALDRWEQQASTGLVAPLIVALNDDDERVRAKALKLIEQDWVRALAAKPEAEK